MFSTQQSTSSACGTPRGRVASDQALSRVLNIVAFTTRRVKNGLSVTCRQRLAGELAVGWQRRPPGNFVPITVSDVVQIKRHFEERIMQKSTLALLAIAALHLAITNGLLAQDYIVTVDTSGAAYSWIDATAGTEIALGDDDYAPFMWPFDFAVYGNTYDGGTDMFEINSNGSVHFDLGGPRTDWVNCGEIPSTIDGQWVAAFGADLDPGAAGHVYVDVSGAAPIECSPWNGRTYPKLAPPKASSICSSTSLKVAT